MKSNSRFVSLRRLLVAVLAVLLAGRPVVVSACPFCSAVSLTFSQEIAQSQVAVIARLVEPPTQASLSPRADGPLPKGRLAVVEALKRVEAGVTVPELCRELGVSSATFYKWRAKFGGMDTSMVARMKELEIENARLKKMYAEERLKAEILNEALTKKW